MYNHVNQPPKSLKVNGILQTINHVPLKSHVMQL